MTDDEQIAYYKAHIKAQWQRLPGSVCFGAGAGGVLGSFQGIVVALAIMVTTGVTFRSCWILALFVAILIVSIAIVRQRWEYRPWREWRR